MEESLISQLATLSISNVCSIIGYRPRMRYLGAIKRNCETAEEYAAFYDVPYAKPPKGLKRYKAPQSVIATSEACTEQPIPTYTANVMKDKKSAQVFKGKFQGSYDCLYMNIFLPKRPERIHELLPVLVYIHGGGFTFGCNDANVYTPDSIIQHGLIFITLNYRVGLHGFLNMHTKECPGNAGLKDQVEALRWIRANIECFKGDPKNITLSGTSAGATCVNLHLISPESKDLFDKAIIQSGGVYAPWGYRGHWREQSKAVKSDPQLSAALYAEEDSETVHRRAFTLLGMKRAERHHLSLGPLFGPSVETIREGAFLPDPLEEMMKNVRHNKPVMAGITKEEGAYLLLMSIHDSLSEWILEDENFRKLLRDTFRWTDDTAEKLFKQIREKYFSNMANMSKEEKNRNFAKLITDLCFRRFYDGFKFGPEKTMHKNLYVYRFDHFSEISTASVVEELKDIPEATHGDETRYLYCRRNTREDLKKYIEEGELQNKEIKLVMNHLCSLWAHFCKFGVPKSDVSPDIEWRAHTEDQPCYLSISTDLTLKEKSLFHERWAWLNELVNEQTSVESLPPSPDESLPPSPDN